jgi:hypothetical protein
MNEQSSNVTWASLGSDMIPPPLHSISEEPVCLSLGKKNEGDEPEAL